MRGMPRAEPLGNVSSERSAYRLVTRVAEYGFRRGVEYYDALVFVYGDNGVHG